MSMFNDIDWNFSAESSKTELFFRTTHSANQLSIYGAVADKRCEDLAEQIPDQTSSCVDRSVSKVHNQLSQKRDPQEVDSLVRTPMRTGGSSEALFVCLSSAISRTEVQFTPNPGVCGIHKTSFCWNALQNCSRFG